MAGEALIDLVVRPDGSVTAALGGGPFNVARTIARLGGEVGFLGSISNDRFGTMLADRLVADGVSLGPRCAPRPHHPRRRRARRPRLGHVPLLPHRHLGTGARPGARRRASCRHAARRHARPGARADGHHARGPLDDVADDVLVMTDPNCRSRVIRDRAAYLDRLARVYRRSHVVKLSTDDAEYLDDATEPIDLARRLVDGGVRVVLLTAGKEATWVVTPTGVDALPTPLVTVADTIGAGDSFCGGFLSWWRGNGFGVAELADHALVVEGALAAQAVSSYTVTQVGANPPHRDDLDASWSSCSRS
ncbi:MAG: PfkB family carbohydrate kinase [Ilumatobacteraceae bacterium]